MIDPHKGLKVKRWVFVGLDYMIFI
jgi:hypothetical protein